VNMNRRRFMIVAIALVAVNSFFWLAQSGFALPRGLINQFFGQNMIRAEVIVLNPDGTTTDERIDRGVIVAVTPALITLREADGRIQPVQLTTGATQIQGPAGRVVGASRLRTNMRVVVYRQANGPANIVQVEGLGG
jgi:hypothetical protein